MPRVSEFFGIVILMYYADHNPPHFHVVHGGDSILIRIEDGVVLAGRLGRTASELVERWRVLHRDELMANWRAATDHQPLRAIEPLR
jgi:hypothetical protein